MTFVSVKARITSDNTGAFTEIPVLLTPSGVLQPLVDYCVSQSVTRSLSWMRKIIQAVTLFLQYMQANPQLPADYRLFQTFATRLYTGTFDRTTGIDPSGLCWLPRPWTTAGEFIAMLTAFFEYLGKTRPKANELNPRYSGSAFDRRMDEIAYLFRREKAFLGHTWDISAGSSDRGHMTRSKRRPSVAQRDPPAFPESRFEELLFKGFKVAGKYDYRGMLITLLLHGAGFRISEPFHMFVEDVGRDPTDAKSALVLIHHPSLGWVPGGWKDKAGKRRNDFRATYLSEMFALAPRDQVMGSQHAGWKNPRLDENYYMQAYWFRPQFGEWFLQIWPYYLREIAGLERNHPFAWVNLHRDPVGTMYSMAMFDKAHRKACERIGLTVAKAMGTTPHGHRHAYGQRMKQAGLGRLVMQRCMHHAAPESQDTYTQPTMAELRKVLTEASDKMVSGSQHPTTSVLPAEIAQ